MVCPFGCQGTLLACVEPAVTSSPGALSAEPFSSHSSPSLYLCPELLHPSAAQHLPLSNFMPLMIVHCSNLSRSLCKASHPSRESTAPPSLVSSANLPRMHSTPAPRSLIKTLNITGPRIEPWETLLGTCHQAHTAPFTTF